MTAEWHYAIKNPSGLPCPLLDALGAHMRSGRLRRFARLLGKELPNGLGVCHDLAVRLMLDLVDAGAADGWRWVEGTVSGTGGRLGHSWNEYAGWAVDASSGVPFISEIDAYREAHEAQGIRTRDGDSTCEYLAAQQRAGMKTSLEMSARTRRAARRARKLAASPTPHDIVRPAEPTLAVPASQRFVLNMIVKNEAHVIRRCLDSVAPFVHYWVICDTGSTDGTQQVVRDYFDARGIPGELHEHEWVDFGTNRTQAIELARGHGDYAFVIDADDTFEPGPDFTMPALGREEYGFESYRPTVLGLNNRPHLLRLDLPWWWMGVLHEIPVYGDPAEFFSMVPCRILRGARICVRDDGARSLDPFEAEKDERVLREALASATDASLVKNYRYHLAQTLKNKCKYREAIRLYELSLTDGQSAAGAFKTLWDIARATRALNSSPAEVIAAYLRAFNFSPTRAEPLFELAHAMFQIGATPLGQLFLAKVRSMEPPVGEPCIAEMFGERAMETMDRLLPDRSPPTAQPGCFLDPLAPDGSAEPKLDHVSATLAMSPTPRERSSDMCGPGTVALYWWQRPDRPNLGDALSPVVVSALSGCRPVLATSPRLVAIGSVLSQANGGDTVWGAGFMFPHDTCAARINVCAVRGPRTRARLHELGIACPEVYGDPAVLMPSIYTPRTNGRRGVGVIPHYCDYATLRAAIRDPSVHVIDVLDDPERVIDAICSCDVVISTSLHGIIVAEAYGIPAAWAVASDKVLGHGFKFHDYYEGTGREANPVSWQGGVDLDGAIRSACTVGLSRYESAPLLAAFPFPRAEAGAA